MPMSMPVCADLEAIDGIDCALRREQGCARFELPTDRVGDVLIVAVPAQGLGQHAGQS